jgi:hypothetical protein
MYGNMPRRVIEKAKAVSDPAIIWNTFIDIIADDPEKLGPEQRAAHFVLLYESEVQNGGHLQYFENHRTNSLKETLSGLALLGAIGQHQVLEEAAQVFQSRPRKQIETMEEYAAVAKQGEFSPFDTRFHGCSPSLGELLGKHLTENASIYIELA